MTATARRRSGHALATCLGVGGALAVMLAGCSGQRSFAELSAAARGVPVPAGLSSTGEHRSVEDGPGFTTSTFREVTRTFQSTLACTQLEQAWGEALDRAGRRYQVQAHPHLYGSTGQVEIVLDDRPGHLGVTLGTTDQTGSLVSCARPFVWSFDDPS